MDNDTDTTRVTMTVTVDLPTDEWLHILGSYTRRPDNRLLLKQLSGWDVAVPMMASDRIDEDGNIIDNDPFEGL